MLKKIFHLIIIALLSVSTIRSQTTSGTDFWLTFGRNWAVYPGDLQIRIVGGDEATTGTIEFTELGTSVPFSLSPYEVYTYNLDNDQKNAVYNTNMGISDKSIHITTHNNKAVTVYAMNQQGATTDATNILPITALGTEYYQISYAPLSLGDSYAVVATENDTKISHNGEIPIPLNKGEVYYCTSATDMTGAHITSNKFVAFFALCVLTGIPPYGGTADHLYQQLAPVHTWGYNFFVPTSHLGIERVRIVASKNGTKIDQIGGDFIYSSSGGYTIDAGQYIELEVLLDNNGCFIQSDNPIGVCTYLTSYTYNGSGLLISDPAQAWLPAIEQTAPNALIAPFIPIGVTNLTDHYAIVMTYTDAAPYTEVSIGGGTPMPLSGGYGWYDNSDAEMSFYIMPLTNLNDSYYFTNDAGLIVLCYGVGPLESYYYLAGSSMRNLSAAFSANGVPYTEMTGDYLFCENEITFTTAITGSSEMDSLRWYISAHNSTVLVHDPLLDDLETWTRTFRAGNYLVKMEVYHNGNPEPLVYEGTLCVGAWIKLSPRPGGGGSAPFINDCFKVGTILYPVAVPN